jgi:hypothetical protein
MIASTRDGASLGGHTNSRAVETKKTMTTSSTTKMMRLRLLEGE